jgi:addiction module HigA family antidote
MLPTNRVPTHPGEMLVEEFLKPLGWTQVQFAEHLGIPVQRVNEIATGKRGVTPETALLLAAALRTSPEFWLNLQSAHDLALARTRFTAARRRIEAISGPRSRPAHRRKAK